MKAGLSMLPVAASLLPTQASPVILYTAGGRDVRCRTHFFMAFFFMAFFIAGAAGAAAFFIAFFMAFIAFIAFIAFFMAAIARSRGEQQTKVG